MPFVGVKKQPSCYQLEASSSFWTESAST